MREFPTKLIPANFDEFSKWKYERDICYLRRDIYEYMLKKDNVNYFDMERFARERSVAPEERERMLYQVKEELENLGWHVALMFNDTAIGIFRDPSENRFWGTSL